VQGTQERNSGTGYRWGTLVDHVNGTYTYTFATDITGAATTCPAPCTDAEGNALDTSYQPGVTHRVSIQLNSPLPLYNAVYDFVPSGGAVTSTRDIVSTAKCNECHNQITAHGRRIEAKMCVTCHNPGSWDNSVAGNANIQTVDFAVMIHKLHHGDELPSVLDPDGDPVTTTKGTYAIGTHDYSTVAFPQDIRNCTKCHDGTPGAANATANGDNWKTRPGKTACAACHDDVYFGATPSKPYQVVSHMDLITNAGGVAVADPADSLCVNCHATGELAGSIEERHAYPALLKAEGARYQFNILEICGVAVASNPLCAPGATPTIKFSVTNPAAGTTYDILSDAAFKCVAGVGLPASVSVLVGWNNSDENNTGSNSNPGQPYTASVLETYSAGTCSANANVAANGSGIFTVTLTGKIIPASGVTGSGRASLYGRINKDVDGNGTKENVRIQAAYKDFGITDSTPVARRKVVDIAKCDKCHDQLSLHGDSRTDEPGLCVICHNPSATDVNRRPKTGGIPDSALALDGKKEETVDFKRLIHGVHAAAKTNYDSSAAHGFRNQGLVIYGYNSSVNDFSHIRFPGILNDCTTCHLTGTYELTGKWEVPTLSGILGSSINTAPSAVDAASLTAGLADQADDLNITPTAAVCSSCHDGQVAQSHMLLNGALFAATQATINTGVTLEACAICHGPGRIADVKVIHGVK
jgi:OmcA/MtrC family decaheme c-type cytochrome